jgi:hypothetical protein
MNNEKTEAGLEALAGDVPALPAKASSPALFIIHYPLSIIHYSLSHYLEGLVTENSGIRFQGYQFAQRN